jgi:uncharacterized protein
MSAYDPHIPAIAAAARDLGDRELDELDELLRKVPRPFESMGIVVLDGYLCGVLVQPVQIASDAWLRYVFDADGRLLADEVAGAWHERAVALILRRYQALNRALTEDGSFDPLIADLDADQDTEADGEPPLPDAAADAAPHDAGLDAVAPASRPLVDWVAGFHFAAGLFPALEELGDDAVALALARIYRHLPAEGAEQRELQAALDADLPLASVEEAVDDLVAAVADIADLTRELRFQVETVRRETPKVGRNDPCPCGSGRKFKRCHGAAGA